LFIGAIVLASALLQAADGKPKADGPVSKPADNAATTATATAPARTPAEARKAADAAVKAAIAELTREVQAKQKSPQQFKLRTQCDYFKTRKSPDVTVDAIVMAVTHTISTDAFADAYIKWQLLSGITSKVDANQAPTLLAAYRNAPQPFVRPGLEAPSKRELDALARAAAQSDVAQINARLHQQVNQVREANEPILEFRDEAFVRLPESADVVIAGLEDGVLRASCGIDSEKHMKAALAQATTWSVGGTPGQIRNVAGAIRTIVDKVNGIGPGGRADAGVRASNLASAWSLELDLFGAIKTPPPPTRPPFPPSYYLSSEWDDKARRVVWKEGSAKFYDVKQLSAAADQLDQTAVTLSQLKR
jgi:hypothetical protein